VADLLVTFGQSSAADTQEWLDARRPRWVMGTPDQARAKVKELEAAGVQRLMLQDFVPRDLEMVRLLGEVFLA
jgi:alkanesulfonate monooxygenase SsuD/methylene tetrahydromethanopterin reductase-like flavin-dependent oxidoreductase (luciferase family)